MFSLNILILVFVLKPYQYAVLLNDKLTAPTIYSKLSKSKITIFMTISNRFNIIKQALSYSELSYKCNA